jgi:hypothetical protein
MSHPHRYRNIQIGVKMKMTELLYIKYLSHLMTEQTNQNGYKKLKTIIETKMLMNQNTDMSCMICQMAKIINTGITSINI